MTTIDNILALADEHASQWDNGRENSHIAREALRTALTEALAQPIDTSPEGVEKSGGNVQVQPVALNWRELVAWWESGAEQWDDLRDIVKKMIQARSAQQAEQGWQPISTAPKNGTEILMYSPPLKNFSVRYRNTRIGWYVSGRIDADDYWGTEVFFNGKSIVQILHNATHWMPLPEAPKGDLA